MLTSSAIFKKIQEPGRRFLPEVVKKNPKLSFALLAIALIGVSYKGICSASKFYENIKMQRKPLKDQFGYAEQYFNEGDFSKAYEIYHRITSYNYKELNEDEKKMFLIGQIRLSSEKEPSLNGDKETFLKNRCRVYADNSPINECFLGLLKEKSASKWEEFIRILEGNFSGTPLFYKEYFKAIFECAKLYYNGEGVEENTGVSREFYESVVYGNIDYLFALESFRDYKDALLTYFNMSIKGEGGNIDLGEAYNCLEKSSSLLDKINNLSLYRPEFVGLYTEEMNSKMVEEYEEAVRIQSEDLGHSDDGLGFTLDETMDSVNNLQREVDSGRFGDASELDLSEKTSQ